MAWIPIQLVLIAMVQYLNVEVLAMPLGAAAMLLLPGVILGRAIGWIQHELLRNHLNWEMDDWIRYSTIGGTLGGVLVVFFEYGLSLWLSPMPLLFAMPLFALCLSMCQWLVLRQTARESWLWILGNVSAGVVFSGLLTSYSSLLDTPLWIAGLWIIATVAQSFITGVVVLWLYDRPLPQRQEPARVFVEIHTNPNRPNDTHHQWTPS